MTSISSSCCNCCIQWHKHTHTQKKTVSHTSVFPLCRRQWGHQRVCCSSPWRSSSRCISETRWSWRGEIRQWIRLISSVRDGRWEINAEQVQEPGRLLYASFYLLLLLCFFTFSFSFTLPHSYIWQLPAPLFFRFCILAVTFQLQELYFWCIYYGGVGCL